MKYLSLSSYSLEYRLVKVEVTNIQQTREGDVDEESGLETQMVKKKELLLSVYKGIMEYHFISLSQFFNQLEA